MPAVRSSKQKAGQNLRASKFVKNTVKIGGQIFKTTIVFDTFWKFAAERHTIDVKRRAGLPPPWTDDEILATTRFCNTYRVSDRGSQYVIRNVIEEGEQTPVELTFRILLWNTFSSANTWTLLEEELGPLTWAEFKNSAYVRVLRRARDQGISLYTGSYQKPAPKLGYKEAFMNHLEFLEILMNNDFAGKLTKCKYLADAFDVIVSYPGMGDFNAFQLLIDLSYSPIFNFSQNDFVIAGLGAQSGIAKCFQSTLPLAGMEPDLIRWMVETQDEHFERLGLSFTGLGPEHLPMTMVDVEHTLCEVDKYSRIAHPKIHGTGRPKKVAGKLFSPGDCEKLESLHLPKAWDHRDRSTVRIRPGKYVKPEKQYVVDKIVAERGATAKEREYLVHWVGYTAKDDTWEPAANLKKDAPIPVEEYLKSCKK